MSATVERDEIELRLQVEPGTGRVLSRGSAWQSLKTRPTLQRYLCESGSADHHRTQSGSAAISAIDDVPQSTVIKQLRMILLAATLHTFRAHAVPSSIRSGRNNRARRRSCGAFQPATRAT